MIERMAVVEQKDWGGVTPSGLDRLNPRL